MTTRSRSREKDEDVVIVIAENNPKKKRKKKGGALAKLFKRKKKRKKPPATYETRRYWIIVVLVRTNARRRRGVPDSHKFIYWGGGKYVTSKAKARRYETKAEAEDAAHSISPALKHQHHVVETFTEELTARKRVVKRKAK